ncbi:hypothetical protein KA005_35625, partial [bacterium]|nr:hypothetical protein [bacterium]
MCLQTVQYRSRTLVQMLLFILSSFVFLTSVNHCVTKPDNKAPTAAFSVTPESGTIETEFIFDASESTDPEE